MATRVPGELKGWQFQEGGREEPAPPRGHVPTGVTPSHLLHPQPLLAGAQDQLPLPTRSTPGCCFPHFLPGPPSFCRLQLRELVGLVRGGRSVFHRHHILPRNA